jgi:hypothetical protein
MGTSRPHAGPSDARPQKDKRLGRRDRAGGVNEFILARDALQVSDDDPRLFVGGEYSQEIGLIEVGFVADTDDLGQTDAASVSPIENGRA